MGLLLGQAKYFGDNFWLLRFWVSFLKTISGRFEENYSPRGPRAPGKGAIGNIFRGLAQEKGGGNWAQGAVLGPPYIPGKVGEPKTRL